MALNANTYYSNSIQGIPGAGVDVNVETVDSSPRYPAGYLVERADGNRFRYCNIGTATNQGELVGPSTNGQLAYTGAAIIAPASATVVPQEYPITPGSIGSHYIQITLSSIAANKYQGAYAILTGGTGVGQTYRIVGNTASNNPTTGTLYIQLYEALQTAVTAQTGIIITQSMFTDLAVTATTAPQVTGVLMGTTTSTNLWGWVCTHGVSGCAEDATNTITAGQQVIASPVTAGSYARAGQSANTLVGNALNFPYIGYSLVPAGSSSRLGTIFLQLE